MKYFLTCLLLVLNLGVFGQNSAKRSFMTIGGSFLKNSTSVTTGGMINLGYGLRDKVSLGFGIDYFKFKGDYKPYIPLYGHLKVYFNDKNICPYLTLAPGYGIYHRKTYWGSIKGGIYLAGSLGIFIRDMQKNQKVGPYIQFGIKHLSYSTNLVINNERALTDFFSLDFGIRF